MSETEVRAKPELKLPDSPNFMVVNGETFFVEKINQAPESILKIVDEYYEENLNVLRAKVSRHLSEEAAADLEAQLGRIERHLRKGIVAIPDDLQNRGQLLTLANNKVYDTRILLFRPTRISITIQRLQEYVEWVEREITRKDAERFTKFVEWAKPLVQHYVDIRASLAGTKVDIKVEQDIIIEPMVAAYIAEEEIIQCAPLERHCHVHDHGRLCTGNTPPRDFWNDPQFLSNFNSINPHSFAFSSSQAARRHKEMLKNQYFVEGRVRESEGAWRVS